MKQEKKWKPKRQVKQKQQFYTAAFACDKKYTKSIDKIKYIIYLNSIPFGNSISYDQARKGIYC